MGAGNNRPNEGRTIAVQQRRLKIERDLLDGQRKHTSLGIKYGVSSTTISKDVKAIMKGWRTAGPDAEREQRLDLIARQEHLYQLTMLDYRRSLYKTIQCKTCKGTGSDHGDWCDDCGGSGERTIEVKGDQQCIVQARGIVMEIARLRGLLVKIDLNYIDKREAHVHVTGLSNAAMDDIIKIKAMVDKAKRRGGDTIEGTGRVIEGETE